jgi:hypothetical protein
MMAEITIQQSSQYRLKNGDFNAIFCKLVTSVIWPQLIGTASNHHTFYYIYYPILDRKQIIFLA